MSDSALLLAAALTTAALFGGMVVFAGGFAAFLFSALPAPAARRLIRRAFPPFYLGVAGLAAVAALLSWPLDRGAAGLLALVALSTWPTRQRLMPAINAATDAGQRQRFVWLHALSVLITLSHIAIAAVVLARFLR